MVEIPETTWVHGERVIRNIKRNSKSVKIITVLIVIVDSSV